METNRSTRAMQQMGESEAMILPSLLLCDFGNLEKEIARLEEAGVRALHLDVMDGCFVPNLTYGMPIVEAVRRLTDLPIDVHLMINDPGKYVQAFVDAGADCLTIHAEIDHDVAEALDAIRAAGVGVGLALNPATPIAAIDTLLPECDLVLVMSVNAGFGGQAFNPVALEKLKMLRVDHPELLLEVDGGVNSETIPSCYEAGASLFVAGSAIFRENDYRQAVQRLLDAIPR